MTNDHDVFTFGFKNEKNSNSGTLSVNIVNAPKITKPKCESNQIGANVGIYDFSVIPTNGMVFFPMPSEIDKNPMTLCSDRPKAKGGNIKSMVAFYNNEALSTVNSLSDSKEIILSGNYPYVSIINPYIQTPNNRTPTFVRLALKDKAGNIFGFTPHKEVADDCRNISKYSSIEDISKCQYSSFSL